MLRECFDKLSENRFTIPTKRWIVRSIAAKRGPRAVLNRYYGMLDEEARSRFHARYAKIFMEHNVPFAAGEWIIEFEGHSIRMPLRPWNSWLDWAVAVSIIGHDIEIVQTYSALIKSDQRPAIFLDVGANYGMHSTLFLSAGIPIIAFEPNPACYPHFQTRCELNGLSGRWEQFALSNESGNAELVYPENETWLGSLSHEVIPTLKNFGETIVREVPLRRLDDYFDEIPPGEVLVKIDVEGFELEVLQGATQILRERKPKLIFESNNVQGRHDLYRLLEQFSYSVHSLPWRPDAGSTYLAIDDFVASPVHNFIAVVSGRSNPS